MWVVVLISQDGDFSWLYVAHLNSFLAVQLFISLTCWFTGDFLWVMKHDKECHASPQGEISKSSHLIHSVFFSFYHKTGNVADGHHSIPLDLRINRRWGKALADQNYNFLPLRHWAIRVIFFFIRVIFYCVTPNLSWLIKGNVTQQKKLWRDY